MPGSKSAIALTPALILAYRPNRYGPWVPYSHRHWVLVSESSRSTMIPSNVRTSTHINKYIYAHSAHMIKTDIELPYKYLNIIQLDNFASPLRKQSGQC